MNRKLVEAGLAKTPKEADGLRKRIETTSTVDEYIAANAKTSSFGPGGTVRPTGGGVAEIGEIRAIMHQEGLSLPLAQLYRNSILATGSSVADYLGADAQPVNFGPGGTPSPLAVFRGAQALISLAGSPEGAIKAIQLFAQLPTTAPGVEEESGRGRRGSR